MEGYVPRQRGLLRLTGPQRIWFLQNTVTADIENVAPGRWTESCFLTPKGKVVAHFRIGITDDEVWLDVDPPGTGPLADWFTRYRFRTKVEIEDRSRGCLTILGRPDLAAPGEVRTDPLRFGGLLGDTSVVDLFGDDPPEGLGPLDPAELERLRLESGVPLFGVDYGPDTLPQEAGLTGVVSVTKGCYVGQEVMARLHFRGHVNRVLRSLVLTGEEVLAGRTLVWDGKPVGTITSMLGALGMGMVRVEVPEGAAVEIEGGGTAVVGPVPEGTKVQSRP